MCVCTVMSDSFPGYLHDPEIEPNSVVPPVTAGRFFTTWQLLWWLRQ